MNNVLSNEVIRLIEIYSKRNQFNGYLQYQGKNVNILKEVDSLKEAVVEIKKNPQDLTHLEEAIERIEGQLNTTVKKMQEQIDENTASIKLLFKLLMGEQIVKQQLDNIKLDGFKLV